VRGAIKSLPPFRAPGSSRAPNIALQRTSDFLVPVLTKVVNACMALGYHPKIWRIFITVTLRKPGKPDYTIPKAYCPNALEETMAKVFESVLGRDCRTRTSTPSKPLWWSTWPHHNGCNPLARPTHLVKTRGGGAGWCLSCS
jgi:hypothetical protein